MATATTATARAAAYRATRPVVNFAAGIGQFWRGLGRFLTSPVLWLYAALPLALLVLVLLGIKLAARAIADAAAGWATSFAEDWPDWIHTMLHELVRWSAILAVHAGLSYLVLPLSIVLAAPCYVLLVRRVERTLGAVGSESPSLWRECAVAIRQAVLVTLVLHLGWALLAPLLLIPGANLLVVVCAVVTLDGFLIGWLMLSVPLQHHGTTSVAGQLRAVWRHRASAIGFGAMSGLILAIPVTPLRVLAVPAVYTGAVLLHRRMRAMDEALREPVPVLCPMPPPRGVHQQGL